MSLNLLFLVFLNTKNSIKFKDKERTNQYQLPSTEDGEGFLKNIRWKTWVLLISYDLIFDIKIGWLVLEIQAVENGGKQ